ncbi:MAG: Glu/Leu/Phe/Val dehydrogenase [candidate division Zixibacteria bacterium]|nr:Glu/Leu/Phe/Val dehydrogenase [candidate division Zixibacteria bacterium]
MSKQAINPFSNALKKLKTSIKYLEIDEKYYDILSKPEAVLEHDIKIEMDSGETKTFPGYRVQFNSARGPYKGGIRFHPEANLDEVKTLAFLMSIKCAVANIPMGGGKGGIQVAPKKLSQTEIEKLSRAWVREFFDKIGPEKDIPAPDVYTNPQIMTWMVDEYSKLAGKKSPAAFTGKPINQGGSAGREFSTSQGGFYVLIELLKKLKKNPAETTVAVQGFGNVGFHAARILHEHGFKVIIASDSKGSIYDMRGEGMDPNNIMKTKKEKGGIYDCYCEGSVCDCENYKKVSNNELLEMDVDVLIPAALENQITVENADRIKAKIVIELANGPITPEADEILFKKGIYVVPDILANAGGVIVSYFEWLQNLKNEEWSEEDVLKKLSDIMIKEFDNVWTIAQDKKIDLRTAAYILAIGRIVEAIKVKK